MKALIVDDEQASRETLANYLSKYCPEVEIGGEAASVQEALQALPKIEPELVFLDVEMPYGNAFDFLESVEEIDFDIIFVTAYSHYAVKALNFSASYYLLKPIDIDELIAAVEKVQENRAARDQHLHTRILIDNLKATTQQQQKVVLPVLNGFEVVLVKDIIRCQADSNFTQFHLLDGSQRLICRTLKFYDEILTELGFMRVHKSHLVNLQYVKGYRRGKGGSLSLEGDHEVEVAPSRKAEVLKQFGM